MISHSLMEDVCRFFLRGLCQTPLCRVASPPETLINLSLPLHPLTTPRQAHRSRVVQRAPTRSNSPGGRGYCWLFKTEFPVAGAQLEIGRAHV